MGDAAGIGPELCLRVLSDEGVRQSCDPVVFGSAGILQRVAAGLGLAMPAVVGFDGWSDVLGSGGGIVDCGRLAADEVVPGRVQAECGAAAYEFVKVAVGAAQAGEVSSIVTAPLNKAALHLAGVGYAGHTEMLADLTSTPDYCMMMAADEIRVCLVTTHVALGEVAAAISSERILKVIELANLLPVERGSGRRPHLTVCGLNPHAGEAGAFGDDEARVIVPAIERARALGADIEGPLPPDTAFMPVVRERTDAYIVMYHDQGLIPFKMLAFDEGVNVTLGLPLVRTSPDHGTAFDIAWEGLASASSILAAVRMALALSKQA
jgi:4-hydroxythreonine-4-phosphate dehydrogenase